MGVLKRLRTYDPDERKKLIRIRNKQLDHKVQPDTFMDEETVYLIAEIDKVLDQIERDAHEDRVNLRKGYIPQQTGLYVTRAAQLVSLKETLQGIITGYEARAWEGDRA